MHLLPRCRPGVAPSRAPGRRQGATTRREAAENRLGGAHAGTASEAARKAEVQPGGRGVRLPPLLRRTRTAPSSESTWKW